MPNVNPVVDAFITALREVVRGDEDLVERLGRWPPSSPLPFSVERAVSWCVQTAMDTILQRLQIPMPSQRPEDRPLLTDEQLVLLEQAREQLAQAVNIDRTEWLMGSEEARRGAGQLWNTHLWRMRILLEHMRRLLLVAKDALHGDSAAARSVGTELLNVLLENSTDRETLVGIAEQLMEFTDE